MVMTEARYFLSEIAIYSPSPEYLHINSNNKLTNQTKEVNHGEKVPAFGCSASIGLFQYS
jgi:hypothetical protein